MGEGDQGDLVKVESTALVPASADPEIDRLRAEIEATRERIRHSIEGLQTEIDDTIDWKRWVRDHPWETVGAAFALGFLLGSG